MGIPVNEIIRHFGKYNTTTPFSIDRSNPETFTHPFLVIQYRSDINGYGLFAKQNIPSRRIVCHIPFAHQQCTSRLITRLQALHQKNITVQHVNRLINDINQTTKYKYAPQVYAVTKKGMSKFRYRNKTHFLKHLYFDTYKHLSGFINTDTTNKQNINVVLNDRDNLITTKPIQKGTEILWEYPINTHI
jgi:hypothetical protein